MHSGSTYLFTARSLLFAVFILASLLAYLLSFHLATRPNPPISIPKKIISLTMADTSICSLLILSFTLLFHSTALEIGIGGGGIIIGGGGGGSDSPQPSQPPEEPPQLCPPPPPPQLCPPPPPSPMLSSPMKQSPPLPLQPSAPVPARPRGRPMSRLRHDLIVIRRFKNKILQNPQKNDPKNITRTWIGNNPCTFKGFKCAMNPIHKQITLSDVQFNGFSFGGVSLDGFIDQLRDVSIFHANSNNFHGQVPPINSTAIPFLFELDLSNNKLSGKFPYQVLKATNLTFLDLRFNNFAGTVPPSVFGLDVDVLFINNNNFLQPLPNQLGRTPALYLTFANNKFTGPIPNSIGLARKTLLEVLFLNNKLSGCLPWQIGLLSLARVFDASRNMLHGPIPSSFSCLENMQILNLAENQLDGVVPEMLCALPLLNSLKLRYNYFTEVGPKCRKLIAKKVLDIRMNCILGLPGQRTPKDCASFFSSHPRSTCPRPYLHTPCKAARYGNGGGSAVGQHKRRRTAEVGPVSSATYGALNRV